MNLGFQQIYSQQQPFYPGMMAMPGYQGFDPNAMGGGAQPMAGTMSAGGGHY